MIPESEILECSKYDVKSKKGNIFVSEKILEKYGVEIYEINPYFHKHYKKKLKLMRKDANIYYLELMFIFLNIN